jgi:DnaJ family protein A protein 5
MEKENKKLREDGIQEYNEAVRSLVAFIRKRDPRVQNNQKSEAERQKALREATAAQAARSRAARQARLEELDKATVPEWAKSRPKDEHEGGFSSESEIEEHEYDCVVCDKTFKSEAQFTAHEKSKKHVKLLKQLQKEMRAEGKKLDIPTTGSPREDPDGHEEPEPEPQSDHDSQRTHFPTNKDDSEASEPSDIVDQPSTASGLDGTTAETAETSEASDNENDDYTSRAKVEERLIGEPSMEGISTRVEDINLEGTGTGTGTGTPATSDPETSTQQQKLGKAKQKRAKKAAQAQQQAEKVVSDIQCAVCKAEFPTKNKLFDHLKANKTHAAPPAQIKGAKASKSKRK